MEGFINSLVQHLEYISLAKLLMCSSCTFINIFFINKITEHIIRVNYTTIVIKKKKEL